MLVGYMASLAVEEYNCVVSSGWLYVRRNISCNFQEVPLNGRLCPLLPHLPFLMVEMKLWWQSQVILKVTSSDTIQLFVPRISHLFPIKTFPFLLDILISLLAATELSVYFYIYTIWHIILESINYIPEKMEWQRMFLWNFFNIRRLTKISSHPE